MVVNHLRSVRNIVCFLALIICLFLTIDSAGADDMVFNTVNEMQTEVTDSFDEAFFTSNSKVNNLLLWNSMELSSFVYDESQCKSWLQVLGFPQDQICAYQYDGKSPDNVAFVIAQKKIMSQNGEEKDLYCVSIRGTVGANEWLSNFDTGLDQGHKGFMAAAATVQAQLDKLHIDPTKSKVLFTGHSRGAAVANYLAGTWAYDIGLSDEDIYAYTFACPNVVLETDMQPERYYSGFYSFRISSDIVPCVPFAQWGFTNFGTNYILDSKQFKRNHRLPENADYYAELIYKSVGDRRNYQENIFPIIKACFEGRKPQMSWSDILRDILPKVCVGIKEVLGDIELFNIGEAHSMSTYLDWIDNACKSKQDCYGDTIKTTVLFQPGNERSSDGPESVLRKMYVACANMDFNAFIDLFAPEAIQGTKHIINLFFKDETKKLVPSTLKLLFGKISMIDWASNNSIWLLRTFMNKGEMSPNISFNVYSQYQVGNIAYMIVTLGYGKEALFDAPVEMILQNDGHQWKIRQMQEYKGELPLSTEESLRANLKGTWAVSDIWYLNMKIGDQDDLLTFAKELSPFVSFFFSDSALLEELEPALEKSEEAIALTHKLRLSFADDMTFSFYLQNGDEKEILAEDKLDYAKIASGNTEYQIKCNGNEIVISYRDMDLYLVPEELLDSINQHKSTGVNDTYVCNDQVDYLSTQYDPTPVAADTDEIIVGDYVTFGSYPQTAEGLDDTPIEWVMLDYDADSNKVLLLSRYGLDMRRYSNGYNRWETCELRKWLNGSFLESAFNPKEQWAIFLTDVDNSALQNFNETSRDMTQDKVFILSYKEAQDYFWNDEDRVCVATAYADAQRQTSGACDWWLRSPGDYSDVEAIVTDKGSIGGSWDIGISYSNRAIRPAIWVDYDVLQLLNEQQPVVMPLLGKYLKIPAMQDTTLSDGSRCILYENVSIEGISGFVQCGDNYNGVWTSLHHEAVDGRFDFVFTQGEKSCELSYDTEACTATLKYPATATCEDFDYVAYEQIHSRIGDAVIYGRYPGSAEGTDKAPVEWIVLDVDEKENKVLLLSRYALSSEQYHTNNEDVTWETSSIREWLNNQFINTAFDENEQNAILTTDVTTGTDPGMDTQDKVFLLSSNDARDCLSNPADRLCTPTDYAVAKGTVCSDFLYKGEQSCSWWLRSFNDDADCLSIVNENNKYSSTMSDTAGIGVRPAIWVSDDALTDDNVVHEEQVIVESTVDDFRTVGKYVTFGHLPQDHFEFDITPVEWLVLDYSEEEDKALLVSKYLLGDGAYNWTGDQSNWETSPIRSFLNGSFLNSTFNSDEQKLIVNTLVRADKNPNDFTTDTANDTQDKVFILSVPEVEKYLPDNETRICSPTVHTLESYKNSIPLGAVSYIDEDSGLWWLRTTGLNRNSNAYVGTSGAISTNGISTDSIIGIRPVIWLDCGVMSGDKEPSDEVFMEGTLGSTENGIVSEEINIAALPRENFVKKGEYVTFGHYPQTWSGNDNNWIEWLVLDFDVRNKEALLISKYGLDAQRFHNDWSIPRWEDSTLHEWLNDDFYNRAFNEEEKDMLIEESPFYQNGSVWILNYSDAITYFEDEESRICIPTKYAFSQVIKADPDKQKNGYETCRWWLNSIEYSDYDEGVGFINYDGTYWEFNMPRSIATVRPVIRVDCKTLLEDQTIAEQVYQIGMDLLASGQYEEAMTMFTAIGDYGDSKEQIAICENAITEPVISTGTMEIDITDSNTEASEVTTTVTAAVTPETNAEAKRETLFNDEYTYCLLGNGTVEIISFVGTESDVSIPDALDGYPVASIGEKAFMYCDSMTSVTIPDTVTNIGDSAFNECTSLTSVSIPDSVTNIGKEAFCFCSSLATVEIPENVSNISDGAFSFCNSLVSVTLPDSVISIGDDAFLECTSLACIELPDSVTSIGNRAFGSCSSLTSIRIPNGVTHISDWTFADCGLLTSVIIPESVTSIGTKAFYDCSSFESVTLSDGITDIGDEAFGMCKSLTSITIPKSVINIGANPFSYCDSPITLIFDQDNCKFVVIDNVLYDQEEHKLIYYPCWSTASTFDIPDGIVSIGGKAFADSKSLTSIKIPDSITHIGDSAFFNAWALTDIKIPSSVTSIGEYAFSCCRGLTSITIPESVTSIGNFAFSACVNLTSIVLPDGINCISRSMFADCDNFVSIVIPDGVTFIDSYAFAFGYSLTSVVIPDSVTNIDLEAFINCTDALILTVGHNSYAEKYAIEHGINYQYADNQKPNYEEPAEVMESAQAPTDSDHDDGSNTSGGENIKDAVTVTESGETVKTEMTVADGQSDHETLSTPQPTEPVLESSMPDEDQTIVAATEMESGDAEETQLAVAGSQPDQADFSTPQSAELVPEFNVPDGDQTTATAMEVESGEVAETEMTAADNHPDPVYLSSPQPIELASKQKPALYTAPSTKSIRLQSGKAVCKTDNQVSVYGKVNDWLLVRVTQDDGKTQMGYIQTKKLKGDIPPVDDLVLGEVYAGICTDTTMHELPDDNTTEIADLACGTEVTYLATEGDWAYVEATVKKKVTRGFVARDGIALKTDSLIPVDTVSASYALGQSFTGDSLVDSNIETSYQYSDQDVPKDFNLLFTFAEPISLDRMAIWNGFWKTTKGKDQYARNGRLEKIEISFLYDGEADFQDPILFTIPETKDWKKRQDGIYVNLSGHDHVVAVRVTPLSVRKGSYFKHDIAISEIQFYTK